MIPTSIYTSEQVRAAEAPLLEAGDPLMARASGALAQLVFEVADAAANPFPRILVLAGPGNNGGDALFAAAHLAESFAVDVLPVSERIHEEGLAAALDAGAHRVSMTEMMDVANRYDLVVDGILGIGSTTSPALRGMARDVVLKVLPAARDGRPRVIAVDLPSGLHPDTGEADEAVLPAVLTVTFGAVKTGLVRGRGPELTGDIVLVDIGLGENLAAVEPAGTAEIVRLVVGTG